MHQLQLDADYTGFSFAPSDLLEAFAKEKQDRSECRETAAEPFHHMTNFVAMHHGWHTGGSLIPSPYLDVEVSNDQCDLLNLTPRDVQMAAIIDQCTGRKATKLIAKHRIEFIKGNVNSYARILNGPQQPEKIKTFNDLSASIPAFQKEK